MNIISNSFFKRVYQKLTGTFYSISYSQTGEDLIIEFLVAAKRIQAFTYLDIGANHPVKLNNTFKFYEKGCMGVSVEPDPVLYAILSAKRKNDICLNIGIAGISSDSADFYIMEEGLLNTFSKVEAEQLELNKHSRINKVIKVPLKTVEEIIEMYFGGKSPVFINIDVEGLDEQILKTFPFSKYRPMIFCLETVHFTDNASSEKRSEIIDLMKGNGYKIFADTYVNTIFVDAIASV